MLEMMFQALKCFFNFLSAMIFRRSLVVIIPMVEGRPDELDLDICCQGYSPE